MTDPVYGCFVYGVAVDQRICAGHGEFLESPMIQRHCTEVRNNEWIEEFPPLFFTEQEAWSWIKLKKCHPEVKPVKLKLVLPQSIYEALQDFRKSEK